MVTRIVRLYKIAKAPGTTAPLRENNHLEQQMNQYRAEEEAMGLGPEGGIDLSLAALAWDTETQDDHVDYNHYAYRPRPISSNPPARAKQSSGREDGERIEMTEKQPTSPSTAYQLPAFSGPAPVPGSFSYAQMQHLQLQRQKYGDNKELYETMVWSPGSSSMDSQGQGQVSQDRAQYVAPPPPPPTSSNWTPRNVGTPLPPIPRKDF